MFYFLVNFLEKSKGVIVECCGKELFFGINESFVILNCIGYEVFKMVIFCNMIESINIEGISMLVLGEYKWGIVRFG